MVTCMRAHPLALELARARPTSPLLRRLPSPRLLVPVPRLSFPSPASLSLPCSSTPRSRLPRASVPRLPPSRLPRRPRSLLLRVGYLEEQLASVYLAEIVLGLEYLHEVLGIVHRDLKPENGAAGSPPCLACLKAVLHAPGVQGTRL